jgi:hypothetical protein
MNQHLIPQALIKRWKSDKGIKLYSLEENKIITEKATSEGVFSSKSINENVDNKEVEDILNNSNIEADFNKLSGDIVGNPKQRLTEHDLNILCRYYDMFGLLSNNYYYLGNDEIKSKLIEYIGDISKTKYTPPSYLIFTEPEEEFLLTYNVFRLKYGYVYICPISPEIIVCFGSGLNNSTQRISKDINTIFNSDFCKSLGDGNNQKIEMQSYVIFRNNTEEYIKQCYQRPQYGQIKVVRINQEQEDSCHAQGQFQINRGDGLCLLGEFGKKAFKHYHF